MQSRSRLTSDSSEPQKRLSIKDRLGPIRGQSSEDRPSSGSQQKTNQQSNEDSYDGGFGRNHWKGTNSIKPGKSERLSNTKKSPVRKEKWLVQNRLKYTSLIETKIDIVLSEKWK